MSETQFIDGLIVKAPVKKDGSPLPDYIKAKGSIHREDLMAWLACQEGEWINFEVKQSKQGKYYAAVDTWKPDPAYSEGRATQSTPQASAAQGAVQEASEDFSSDIPFANPYKGIEYMV